MKSRWVAFVPFEPVVREINRRGFHEAVASDFCDDAGGGNAGTQRIPANQGGLGNRERLHGPSVNEDVTRRGPEGSNGFAHRLVSCPENIDVIDLLGIANGRRPRDSRVSGELLVETISRESGEFFGIIESDDVRLSRQNDRGGHDGASQGAASGFVDSRDGQVPVVDETLLRLEVAGGQQAHGGCESRITEELF